ncbi:MAG TPA: DNA polymerase III subunit epsilon [Lentisphaeria bacterium]|nr:MAG: DNA polymerase III subunit epsilon [Lentisphaerae bacterium GWF2_38_69]HBM15848.1 DNA polymerase III subunit epsilon [Lentisphaeria bacterium]
MNFAAIDFETATGHRHSACAVAIVTVQDGRMVDEYYSLIQPPGNEYWYRKHIEVHGITPKHTKNMPLFSGIYPEIRKRLAGKILVAHNESFDRNVLFYTMSHYALDYSDLNLNPRWECTCKIYRSKGFNPARLDCCCQRMGIELQHHQALSDARACAFLYLNR